jgi:uncharacterized protein
MKKAHTGLQLKSLNEQGQFSGYASIFGIVDSQNDLVLEGAFAETLEEGAQDIKLLWQHDFNEPIGVFTAVREDARGLYVEGKLLLEVQRAREAHALLKAGAIAGLSIGYTPVKYRTDPKSGVRLLEEVALYEISLVTFPANGKATVQAVKRADVVPAELARLAGEIGRAISVLGDAYSVLGKGYIPSTRHRVPITFS